jgi:hypothetical protein
MSASHVIMHGFFYILIMVIGVIITMTLHIEEKRFGNLVAKRTVGTDTNKNIVWECVCDCGNLKYATAAALKSGKMLSCSKACGHTMNLSGLRFGKLVAKKMVGKNEGDGVLWECACDCGSVVIVPSGRLTRTTNPTKSCGCSRWKSCDGLIGRRFNKLTIVDVYWKGETRSMARCLCDCGTETVVRISQLIYGAVFSCGCLKRRRGKDNPLWRQDLPQEERLLYKSRHYGWPELCRVRDEVFERDQYRCSCCGCRSSKGHPLTINAHHLENWCGNIEKRLDVDNVVTVCSPCHRFFHSLYGKKNNSADQFSKFRSFFIPIQ